MRVETEKFFNSFHSEYSDQVQTRAVLDLVRADSRKYYQVYRTYVPFPR